MKKSMLFVMALGALLKVNGQTYNLFETTITCDKSQKEIMANGRGKINLVLEQLVKDGKLVNFAIDQSKEKLTITVSAENDSKFKEIIQEWKTRCDHSYPEVFQSFWNACPKRKDTIMNKLKVTYPLIKNLWSPVAVIDGIDELPDPKLDYNIVVDFTTFPTVENNKEKIDSSGTNWGLVDLGRNINLHVVAGVPKEKIHYVVAVHGYAVKSFLNNEAYRKKYKIDNPNLKIIEELGNAGVKFLVCGQSLNWSGDKKEMLVPQAKVSLTAQTTLSSYQMKGYALKMERND